MIKNFVIDTIIIIIIIMIIIIIINIIIIIMLQSPTDWWVTKILRRDLGGFYRCFRLLNLVLTRRVWFIV